MKLTPTQINILSEARIDGNKLYLQGQLDRKSYTNINEVLETIGAKWNRKEKAHIFDGECLEEAIDEIIDSGEVETLKETIKKFQFYPTPKEVAEYLVELSDIQNSDQVLEPSAGLGHIVDEILPKIKNGSLFNNIVLIEKDVEKVNILKEKYECYGGMRDYETGTGTYSKKHLMNIFVCDFLDNFLNDNSFDKIIANPPFSKSQDVKHILHMYKFLKKGGVLVSVASAGIKTRQGKLYDDLRSLDPEYIDLPDGSFKESGTMVGTVIVRIKK